MPAKEKTEDIEIRLLLDALNAAYGYDFRGYAYAGVRRRVLKCVEDFELESVSALQGLLLRDTAAFGRFLSCVTISVTSMFRDPAFFRALREKVCPVLYNEPGIRAWVAGCSTGEEVYSLAILLEEAGLAAKSRIYATDLSAVSLAAAKEGIYRLRDMKKYTRNYLDSGGRQEFSGYYLARGDHAIMDKRLKKNIVWSEHNLACDGSFNEFQLILCRNVLIYFDRPLQDAVLALLYSSLAEGGTLGFGAGGSVAATPLEKNMEHLPGTDQPLFRRLP